MPKKIQVQHDETVTHFEATLFDENEVELLMEAQMDAEMRNGEEREYAPE